MAAELRDLKNWYRIVDSEQTRKHSPRGTEVLCAGTITILPVRYNDLQFQHRVTLRFEDYEDYDTFMSWLSSVSCKLSGEKYLEFQVQEIHAKHCDDPWTVVLRSTCGWTQTFKVNQRAGIKLLREFVEDLEEDADEVEAT